MTEITLMKVTRVRDQYFVKVMLPLFWCTKSRNRLTIIVETLMDVALGHPYWPEQEPTGRISGWN
jgi:hypothetical protein